MGEWGEVYDNNDKTKRIDKEEVRLRKVYKDLPPAQKCIADGLIRRAAFMRIALEDFEEDIILFGATEKFSQSDKLEPYDRERPVVRLYNSMNANYQKVVKQLNDMVDKRIQEPVKSDGFDEFASGRDD